MPTDKEIWALIRSLSLPEKAALCSGADTWTTKANPKKGIPSLRMADGPHGVRHEDRDRAKQNGGNSRPATCFPTASALACSWSPALLRQIGEALGSEARDQDVRLLLGPGVNIKRDPRGGRNFEYFSEDPLLAGELGAAWIDGVQSMGVGASLKHYALNNQETKRMSINVVAEERALYDLYLKPFQIAVQQAKPATVMASYNKVDGVYASENRNLLNQILRLRFGFDGVVVSDWGAVNNRAAGIYAGLDLEMPASAGLNDAQIVQAVQNGSLPQDALDTACWNLLRLIFRYSETESPKPFCDYGAHHSLAVDALCKSAVLLKNVNNLLPFDKSKPLCVIDDMAKKPRYQGGGSSIVNPTRLVSFLQALDEAEQPYTYLPGYRNFFSSIHKLPKLIDAVRDAPQVVVFAGLPDLYDCETYDRSTLRLPPYQEELLTDILCVNPNLCVVLCCGGPVTGAWLNKAPAVLCLHLGGQGLGEATRRLLFGEENPSGKLAESWPLELRHVPSYDAFPMGPRNVVYSESLFVGYRYYNTFHPNHVRFHFGHGLSYTRFHYGTLTFPKKRFAKGEAVTFSFRLTNTGLLAGEEISQVYLERNTSEMWQPCRELIAFARTALAPGQTKTVHISIPYNRFAQHDPKTGTAVVEAGRYLLRVGKSSANKKALYLHSNIHLDGVRLYPPAFYQWTENPQEVWQRLPAHMEELARQSPAAPGPDELPDYDSRTVITSQNMRIARDLNPPRKKGEYTMDTTLGEMRKSMLARFIRRVALLVGRQATGNMSTDPKTAKKVLRASVDDLPMKNLLLFALGFIDHQTAALLLQACNGRGGLCRALGRILASLLRGGKAHAN